MLPAGSSADHAVDEELVISLRTGVMRLSRRLRNERSGNDLTLTQLSALGTLHRDGAQTISELAKSENVKPPSMTRTVNQLARADLVSRHGNVSDGRQVIVALTPRAEAVLREDRRRRDAWLTSHLAELTDNQCALLRRVAPLLDALAQD